ncbi:phosphoribosylamine--glycine ligase [Candidatus Pacearchaeota archaeon]|nr:phosphoribosylamine--glycine ligase [Candidatus Pacearchaeota archaeon]|tara:strand:- start:1363 stop:2712 length:1350 start_codon:yes stop_codon:yes gene_type:complete
MYKVLLIGKSARIDCIADALRRSHGSPQLYALSEVENPGLREKVEELKTGYTDRLEDIREVANKVKPDFAVIGPEEPLAVGAVDVLSEEFGIPCIGPGKSLARLESSKLFTRELLSKYDIPGNPDYRIFRDIEGIESYLHTVGEFVVKPDGLTGGKGVKVFGEHLHSIDEALQYSRELFHEKHQAVVIEEKLEGEEFSLQSLCDGQHVVDMVVAQDHKRAYDGDTGPNTGGMGSYSCKEHDLPFISKEHIQEASEINSAVARALREEVGSEYKGVLYGGFMFTKKGLRLIEYNARFGDPEVMNVLPLLKTDFMDVCEAILNGTLDRTPIEFERKATVCKYVVPEGYPDDPIRGARINMSEVPSPSDELRMFYGAVYKEQDELYMTGSRAVAFVGIGDDLEAAEQIAEDAVNKVIGPVRHRRDIGTYPLIQKRIDHIEEIMHREELAQAL